MALNTSHTSRLKIIPLPANHLIVRIIAFMRNLFETMYSNQANRLADELDISDDALTSLTVSDLPEFILEHGM
mgnify:CR=1 FL=1